MFEILYNSLTSFYIGSILTAFVAILISFFLYFISYKDGKPVEPLDKVTKHPPAKSKQQLPGRPISKKNSKKADDESNVVDKLKNLKLTNEKTDVEEPPVFYSKSGLLKKTVEPLDLTEDQKKKERDIQSKQLKEIFNLMQEQQDKFGNLSLDDIQDQMRLYQ